MMSHYIEVIGEWIEKDMALINVENPLVFWKPERKTITLNGDFTAEQLRAMAQYMDPDEEF